MKKITVTAIALSMAMAMTGCSGNSTETTAASEAETTAAETSAAETSAAETSAAETSAAEAGEVSVMTYEEYMAAEIPRLSSRLPYRQSSPGGRTRPPFTPRMRTAHTSFITWPAPKRTMKN